MLVNKLFINAFYKFYENKKQKSNGCLSIIIKFVLDEIGCCSDLRIAFKQYIDYIIQTECSNIYIIKKQFYLQLSCIVKLI